MNNLVTWQLADLFDKLPADVVETLTSDGWTPSAMGVYYREGETCYCGAFMDKGCVLPVHRLCEQADGDESLQSARYFLYLMACSCAYYV